MNKVETKKDGKPITLYIKRPDRKIYQKAQAIASGAFREATKNGAMLKAEVDAFMKERGLWNKEKQKEFDKYNKKIDRNLLKLKSGGISLAEGKKLAIETRELRVRRTLLVAERNQLDDYTAETQASNERFDFLVSECVFDEEGNRIFKDLDDYKYKSEEQYAFDCASALSTLLYGLNENWESELPENKFLIKYGFMNKDLHLINQEQKLVDVDGKLVNEDFQYINEDGKPIDDKGNILDEDGLPHVEFSPFLDEEGNPIV